MQKVKDNLFHVIADTCVIAIRAEISATPTQKAGRWQAPSGFQYVGLYEQCYLSITNSALLFLAQASSSLP